MLMLLRVYKLHAHSFEAQIRRKHNSYGKIHGSTRSLLQSTGITDYRIKREYCFPSEADFCSLLISNDETSCRRTRVLHRIEFIYLFHDLFFISLVCYLLWFLCSRDGKREFLMEMCSTRHIFDNEEYQTRRYTLRNRQYLKYKVQYKVRRNIFITRDKMFAATNRYHIQWLIILMNALCNRHFVLFRASTRL